MKILLTVVLVMLFNINSCFAQVTFPVERPVLKQGERWKTTTLDGFSKIATGWREESVIGVGAEMFLMSIKTNEGEQPNSHLDLDTNRLLDVKGKLEREIKLSFPLEIGKSWKSRWAWINPRGHEGSLDMTYKVGSSERITVAAGIFDTVIVNGSGFWNNKTAGGSGAARERLWYAPQAKRIIRRTWVTTLSNGMADQNRLYETAEIETKQ